MDVQHTAILVSDLDETTEFYENKLGLEYAWDFHTDEGIHNYYVTGDELDTWIQFIHDPKTENNVNPDGIVHLAIVVDDVDTTFDRLVEKSDCPVIEEPNTVEAADARVAFVEDPNGYEVEIFSNLEKNS